MKIKRLISKLLCLMLVVCLLSALTAYAASPGESDTGTITVNDIALQYTWGSKYITNATLGIGDSHSTTNGSVSFGVSGGTISMAATASKYSKTSFGITFSKYAQDSQVWVSFQNNDSQGRTLDITYTCSGSVKTPNSTPLSGTIRLEYGESFPDIASATGFYVIHDVAKDSTSTTGVSGTITITNISVVQEVDLGLYSSTRGSYTYKVGEADATPIAANASVANPEVSVGSSVVLTATGTSEYDFYGWMNGNGKLLSTANPYTLTVNASTNVYPVFLTKGTTTTAPFSVDGTPYMFWHQALEQAKATGKTVVVAENYTLRPALEDNGLNACVDASVYNQFYNGSGTFTVPSGITLLIPFDSAYTMYTNCNAYYGETMTTPTAFRTLTMASGTTIVVNGTMNVAGRFAYTNSGGQSGSPTGPLGFVQMNEGSNITVNGSLYAYGYIIGVKDSATGTYKRGTVTVNSGATVYEVLQMPEYRGGDQSTGMDHNVFPLSQFYVQNIEVPMTLYAGATEKTYGKVYASRLYFDTGITLFGSGGMFALSSGSVTKWYDGTTDRLYIEINGDATMNSVELVMNGLGLPISVNSADFVLPINGGFVITIKSGSNLTIPSGQDVLLQPGAQIIIEEKATVTVNSALYIYDAAQWGAYSNWGHAGAGDSNCWDTPVIPVSYSPTRTYVRPHVFPRGLFTDSSGNPIYITEDPAIYEAIFGKNSGDLIAEADLAEFLANHLPDASILVNGTLSGNIYTTAGGANIYSTGAGQFTQTATANSSVWQLMMGADYSFNSGNSEYYVEAVSSPATLQNGGDRGTVTSVAGTYKYINGYWHGPNCDGSTTTKTNDATCTVAGSTVTKCACGIINETEPIPALGHSYTYTLSDGMYVKTCACGDTVTEYPLTLKGISLWTDGEVGLWLKVEISDILLQHEDAYIVVTEAENAIEDEQVTKYTMADLKKAGADSNGRYVLKQSIASGEMTGDVTITAFLDENTKLCIGDYKEGVDFLEDTDPYSVTRTVIDYVRLVLAADPNTYADLQAMVTAMVTYGGYAQQYFGVNTDNLAYSVLEDFEIGLPNISNVNIEQKLDYPSDNTTFGLEYTSQTVTLDSKISLKTYFTLSEGTSIEDYTFTYTRVGFEDGGTLTPVQNGSRYYVLIENIPVAYWDSMYDITITDSAGNTYVVTSSVLAWIGRCLDGTNEGDALNNLARAMYLYNQAANTKFGK